MSIVPKHIMLPVAYILYLHVIPSISIFPEHSSFFYALPIPKFQALQNTGIPNDRWQILFHQCQLDTQNPQSERRLKPTNHTCVQTKIVLQMLFINHNGTHFPKMSHAFRLSMQIDKEEGHFEHSCLCKKSHC